MSRQLTQCQAVLAVLEDGRWHSSIEFVEEGVLRAAARVHELRSAGFPIETRRVESQTGAVYEYRLRQLSAQEELLVRQCQQALEELDQHAASDEPAEQLRLVDQDRVT